MTSRIIGDREGRTRLITSDSDSGGEASPLDLAEHLNICKLLEARANVRTGIATLLWVTVVVAAICAPGVVWWFYGTIT